MFQKNKITASLHGQKIRPIKCLPQDPEQIIYANSDSSKMFFQKLSLKDIDFSNLSTKNVTNMHYMFYNAGYTANIFDIDLSNWDVSNVTNMNYMFANAGHSAKYSLNLSSWNVDKVTSHNNFYGVLESKIIPPIWKK